MAKTEMNLLTDCVYASLQLSNWRYQCVQCYNDTQMYLTTIQSITIHSTWNK